MSTPVRVTIWNEYLHELENEHINSIYPDGIHSAIAKGLEASGGFEITSVTLRQPGHGLGNGLLDTTDVLIWWGHKAHHEVDDDVVADVHRRVLGGMGLIVLHSGHFSKIFQRVMGSDASLKWRAVGERERLWNLQPSHPILDGIPDYVELDHEEMYGEPFGIPEPQELLMISWFQGGEVFRSLCTWRRGHGRVVYFRPGHETYPTYYNPHIQRIIANAARWAQRRVDLPTFEALRVAPVEPLPNLS